MPIWTARGYISWSQAAKNARRALGMRPSAAEVALREAEYNRLLVLGDQQLKDKKIAELEDRINELE